MKTKTQHTPGPFVIFKSAIEEGDYELPMPYAAAPELLEALIGMQATAGTHGSDAKRALDKAYAAIAKAEGRE